jgi:hypothetical protein
MNLTNKSKTDILGFRSHTPTKILKRKKGGQRCLALLVDSTFQPIEVIAWQVAPQQSSPPLGSDKMKVDYSAKL